MFFSGQSTRRSSRVILTPPHTKWFSSLIDQVARPLKRDDSPEEFQNKDLTKKKKSQKAAWELRIGAILFNQFSSILSPIGGSIEGIS